MTGTSAVVQGLRLQTFTAGGTGSILSWGSKIPYVAQHGRKKIKVVASTAAFQMSDGSVTILNLYGENFGRKNCKLQNTDVSGGPFSLMHFRKTNIFKGESGDKKW